MHPLFKKHSAIYFEKRTVQGVYILFMKGYAEDESFIRGKPELQKRVVLASDKVGPRKRNQNSFFADCGRWRGGICTRTLGRNSATAVSFQHSHR